MNSEKVVEEVMEMFSVRNINTMPTPEFVQIMKRAKILLEKYTIGYMDVFETIELMFLTEPQAQAEVDLLNYSSSFYNCDCSLDNDDGEIVFTLVGYKTNSLISVFVGNILIERGMIAQKGKQKGWVHSYIQLVTEEINKVFSEHVNRPESVLCNGFAELPSVIHEDNKALNKKFFEEEAYKLFKDRDRNPIVRH